MRPSPHPLKPLAERSRLLASIATELHKREPKKSKGCTKNQLATQATLTYLAHQ